MASAVPPADDERLPWLVPYRDPVAAKRPVRPRIRKSGVALVVGAIASIAAALVAGYYLGQRQQQSQPRAAATGSETTVEVRRAEPATDAVPVPPATAAPPQVVGATERESARRAMHYPAGHVVQLGAFQTRRRALFAHRVHMKRHPDLASMPRIVVPVTSKPSGRVLYALRLGTASRQQSREVCRNIQVSGDDCLVIG